MANESVQKFTFTFDGKNTQQFIQSIKFTNSSIKGASKNFKELGRQASLTTGFNRAGDAAKSMAQHIDQAKA